MVATIALLGLASQASATTITNGTVTLGVNAQGDLNSTDAAGFFGVTYNATGNDGTRAGCLCEGWGAGAGGPTAFQARANEALGNDGYTPVSFTSTPASAVSVVDILREGVPALRLTQDFHPSPTTPNLYEITTTLENISGGPLTDVRYERVMDWDVEPTAFSEFVTINRGSTPPADLIYSDDNGFSDTYPFTNDPPDDPSTVNTNYEDKGPADHGARFTFSFGDLAAGEGKQFFLYYGAAGNESDANAAVSAAALEVFSYGQPDVPDGDDPDELADGPAQGMPNTFIWGFRAVGGTPVIPPTLTLSPQTATSTVGGSHTATAMLSDSDGNPVPGAEIVFAVSGTHSASGSDTTDASGQASFSYTGTTAGDDTITACLDSNDNGACDLGEVTDTATKRWEAGTTVIAPPPPQPRSEVLGVVQAAPVPTLAEEVVAGVVSGTVRIRGPNGRFRTLGANEAIPVGSEVDATKGRVKITAAVDRKGQVQSSDFYKGAFKVTQDRKVGGTTHITLSGGKSQSCPSAKKRRGGRRATASARKKVRRLFGDGKGKFETRGRHGAATVRGTKWLTQDRCDGTYVRVQRGVVTVRDFARRKTVTVRQGKSYLAKSP